MRTPTQSNPPAGEPTPALCCLARDVRTWIAAVVLVLATFAAFYPMLHNGFALDDEALVNNPHIRHLDGAELRWALTTWDGGRYQPLTWLTFAANYALGGLNPTGYHLTDLILHILNTLLVYALALRLITAATQTPPTGRSTWGTHAGAFVAAALWGLHPLRVDAVAWASQRAFLLGTLFALTSVLFYLRSCVGPCRRASLVAAVVCYGPSLLAGPFAILLPLALLALEIYPLRRLRGGRAAWLDKLPFLLLAALVGVPAIVHLWTHVTTASPGGVGRTILVVQALAFHVWKTVWPTGFVPVYELHLPLKLSSVRFLLSAGSVVFAIILLVVYARRAPALLVAALAYVALALPFTGIVPLGQQEVGERYGYLAMVAWMILLGGGIATLANRPRAAQRGLAAGLTGLTLLAAATLGVLTERQCRVWRSADTVWSHIYAHFEGGRTNALAAYHVAQELERAGESSRAINLYEYALSMRPGLAGAYERLAQLQLSTGDFHGALDTYRSAVAAHPKSVTLQRGYGVTLAALGLLDQAEPHLRRALELDPSDVATRRALGNLLLLQDRAAEAVPEFEAAVAARPDDAEAFYDLGRAEQRVGDRTAALNAYRRVLELDSSHALARRAVQELTDSPAP